MRRAEFAMSPAEARGFLASQSVVRLAGCDAEGLPVLRTVHGVVVGEQLCFHAAPAGEKQQLVGRPVVVQAEEVVATVPSTFFDPERACPATTYYRSVQAHGVLREVDDPEGRALVLQRLMEHLQPEGGHVPITAEHPLYRAAVAGLLVAGVSLEGLTGKAKLAQNRTPAQRAVLLEKLWRRGDPGDARAIELLRAANPDTPTPDFLRAPERLTLHGWLDDASAPAAAALVAGEYWNDRFTVDELAHAHRRATAWVGARDEADVLVGTARALSDGAKNAWLYDVCVAKGWRGRGLGQALVRLLLDHPGVRGAHLVHLGTRDAQGLYARFGFTPRTALPPRPYAATEMTLLRWPA